MRFEMASEQSRSALPSGNSQSVIASLNDKFRLMNQQNTSNFIGNSDDFE